MNKIECKNVCKSFVINKDELNVLNDINLEISEGDKIAITGMSGAGKSSFLHILAGLDKPTSGNIFLNNMNLAKLNNISLSNIRLNNFAFVYQFHHLLDDLTIEENIYMPAYLNNSLDKSKKYIPLINNSFGLKKETYVIYNIAKKLNFLLKKNDPIKKNVKLSHIDLIFCFFRGIIGRL